MERAPALSVITTAPTTPVTCDRDPAWSATAVRDPLVLTGNPWNRPAPMFAAPIPIISWLPRTRSPRRDANDDAVDMVSARATTAIASAPTNSGGTSDQAAVGMVNGGKPRGSTPMVSTPCACRSNALTANRGEYHGDEHGRHLGQQPLQQQDPGQRREPYCRRRRVCVIGHMRYEGRELARPTRSRRPRSRTASAAGRRQS